MGMEERSHVPTPAVAMPETANAAGAMQHHGSAVTADPITDRTLLSLTSWPVALCYGQ